MRSAVYNYSIALFCVSKLDKQQCVYKIYKMKTLKININIMKADKTR